MNTQSIRKYWSDIGETLYTYKLPQLSNPMLLKETIEFLSECGLPNNVAPGISFDFWNSETIPTPDQVLHIEFDGLEHYLMIGSNGSGDPVCIDLEINNEIVYLSHDNYFERVFMNSSVSQLIQAIIRYQAFHASLDPKYINDIFTKRRFSDEEYVRLKADFLKIDHASMSDNSWWNGELEYLLWERDNEDNLVQAR
jgi:hypothetical protein